MRGLIAIKFRRWKMLRWNWKDLLCVWPCDKELAFTSFYSFDWTHFSSERRKQVSGTAISHSRTELHLLPLRLISMQRCPYGNKNMYNACSNMSKQVQTCLLCLRPPQGKGQREGLSQWTANVGRLDSMIRKQESFSLLFQLSSTCLIRSGHMTWVWT